VEGAIARDAIAAAARPAPDVPAAPPHDAPAADLPDAHPAHCLNCGTPLAGRFCHACGQKAHLHRSVGHILEELVHGVLHWDSKLWRTLPLLVVNPGRLTRDYVRGRRARYIAPLSLFLGLFLVMFLGFSVLGPSLEAPPVRVEMASKAVEDISADLARARANPATSRAEILALEAALASAQAARDRAERGEAPPPGSHPIMDSLRAASQHAVVEVGGRRNEALTRKVKTALANPEFTFYRIKQKAYKLAFLLVPLSVPVLWLLFARRRGVYLYDHTVFVLYSLSFMSLLAIALLLASQLGEAASDVVTPLALLAPGVHMFAQLKGAYQLGWGAAAWRTVLLLLGSLAVALAYVLLMLVLGLLD
jgi:hypothetical protein